MADTTGTYGFPFLELGDPPNIAQGLEDLAEAIETKLIAVDAAIAAINNLATTSTSTTTDEAGFTNTTFAPGGLTVGLPFVAPPSGAVIVTITGQLSQNINTQATFLSVEVKTGVTVGSGTLVGAAANSDRALVVGRAVNAGAIALAQNSRQAFFTGLTPGASYNARLMHCVDGGSGTLNYREILVQPQL